MVKEKTGRVRYILFQVIKGQVSRRQLNEYLIQEGQKYTPRLTFYDGIHGIVRCLHYQKNDTLTLLRSLEWIGQKTNKIQIKTIATSGTIKKLKKYL